MTFPFLTPFFASSVIARSGSTIAQFGPDRRLAGRDGGVAVASHFFFGTNTSASASRGIALCLFPPSIAGEPHAESGERHEHAVEDLDGVAAVLVDLQTGMAALRAR